MKIAISAHGTGLDAMINPRFGRCDYFIVVDTTEDKVDAYPNENMNAGGGTGIQAASFVISKGVSTVLTGSVGPNAMDVFAESGVQVIMGQSGMVGEVVDRFKAGDLSGNASSVAKECNPMETGVTPPMAGGGRGMGGGGRGMGGGGGRGMGGGGGRGMGGGGGRGMGR